MMINILLYFLAFGSLGYLTGELLGGRFELYSDEFLFPNGESKRLKRKTIIQGIFLAFLICFGFAYCSFSELHAYKDFKKNDVEQNSYTIQQSYDDFNSIYTLPSGDKIIIEK